jgi:ribonuclease E
MANKMLIDAIHPEETRVVVLRGNRVEEFDFESADKKPLRGNIYLAKVTRVEPSLQAAFVDYGGNRHGFLAFSEIHPDYYQIPVSDRQALIEEDAAAHRDDDDDEGHSTQRRSRRRRGGRDSDYAEKRRANGDEKLAAPDDAEIEAAPAEAGDASAHETGSTSVEGYGNDDESSSSFAEPPHESDSGARDQAGDEDREARAGEDNSPAESGADNEAPHRLATDPEGFAIVDDQDSMSETGAATPAAHEDEPEARFRPQRHRDDEDESDEEADVVEQIGGDAMEEVPMRPHRLRRQYKIQEVIKRRQVLLIQVVKEERGNKGAALTTYLSLAGRYSVLMPNTARGGGISRKITDSSDRQRLKAIAGELEVPEGMGVILRTAGAARTKAEVKRDFEYLLRMWETVREVTLKSTAPMLVYEEGSLVKRAIRDLYNKDIDEVIVSGETGYREAKEFMRMLMPSHAKNVQPYRDPQPIFAKSGVEAQLDAMFSNHVPLKSGGYLVINQTEALVAIDVNSGRSTREHNIEDTALRTNLEAADEVARQLRLRDLAGLIVVDFIDMEESRNNRSVERRMKDALKNDRARIQIGRISHFGLLEMSRQRIRTGVLEGSSAPCPHCAGSGMVRSTASVALHVLRVLEDALIKSAAHNITVRTRAEVALYILNQKRVNLCELELRFGVAIAIVADDNLTGTVYHAMERGELAAGIIEPLRVEPLRTDTARLAAPAALIEDEESDDGADDEDAEASDAGTDQNDANPRKRRRRRRGRGRDREATGIAANAPQPSDEGLGFVADDVTRFPGPNARGDLSEAESDTADEPASDQRGAPGDGQKRDGRRRRSRRRGGRGPNEVMDGAAPQSSPEAGSFEAEPDSANATWAADAGDTSAYVEPPAAPAPKTHGTAHAAHEQAADDSAAQQHSPAEAIAAPTHEAPPQPKEKPAANEPPVATLDPDRPKKTGWWQRAKASIGG